MSKGKVPARILTGLCFLLFLAGVCVVDLALGSVRATEILLCGIVLLALRETYALFADKGMSPASGIGQVAGVGLIVLKTCPSFPDADFVVLSGLLVALLMTSAKIHQREGALARIASTVTGFAYAAWLPSAGVAILELPGAEPRQCLLAAYWVVLVAKATDIGGYVVGKSMGRTKLIESVSPNKTVEGAIGGVVLAVAAAVGLARAFHLETFSPLFAAFAGVAISIASQLGDLLESLMKRSAGVKDSSARTSFGIFGGFLDLLDSLVLALPVGLLLVQARGL
ncbi:MAG: phosphatidate cytidylyltransferase [Planctomycetes bacterium]|nr:phosphatidate cytidylyltransferase [Planctomycetota bacterium]MBI3847461.1 phosphatidate cytidylyltransferase [Planctomycetota bacterium]